MFDSLILNVVKKKSKRNSVLGLIVCFVLFIVAYVMTPPPQNDTTSDEPQEPVSKPAISDIAEVQSEGQNKTYNEEQPVEEPAQGTSAIEPETGTFTKKIDIKTLWSKLEGVWYDPKAEYTEFFVIDSENNNPIAYYVWGSDKSENTVATGTTEIGNGQYQVTLENPEGDWEWIFDCSKDGTLIVSDVDGDYSYNYSFLASTLEKAYEIYDSKIKQALFSIVFDDIIGRRCASSVQII